MTSRLAGLGAVLALGAAAVSGCGVTGTDFRPGVAAEVGEQTVRVVDVDDAVSGVCDYLDDQPDQQPQARSVLRASFVQSFLEKEAMKQLLDEQGVSLPAEYERSISQAQAQFADLPDSQGAAINMINEAGIYVRAGELALGRSQGGATDDATATNAGAGILLDWIKDGHVEVNPMFGFGVDGVAVEQRAVDQTGQTTIPILTYTSLDDTSIAVSDQARAGLPADPAATADPAADEARQAYVATLSSNQTCG